MSTSRNFRDQGTALVLRSGIFALALLGVLLIFRGTPPHLPTVGPRQSAVQGRHNCRLFFDHDDFQSVAAAGTALPTPRLRSDTQRLLQSEVVLAFDLNGFHYNRPPPHS
ncbi:MAG: hypothetical protein ACRD2S_08160 [Terriglobales bacterium]